MNKPVAVLGSGHFGVVVANIIASKNLVLLYSRSQEKINKINQKRLIKDVPMHSNIIMSCDLEYVANQCDVIIPILPSKGFINIIKSISPFLRPYHVIIHGTKGLDVKIDNTGELSKIKYLKRSHVRTMSELIIQETIVTQVGCISGPNLSKEIAVELPTATVIASHFDNVLDIGKKLLNCERFRTFYSHDLFGIEICGAIKNIIALAAGIVKGLKLGDNALGVLLARGLLEMIDLGQHLGGQVESFIGLAGIGDMVTTSMSDKSRNYQFGYQFARANKDDRHDLLYSFDEPVEGVHTVLIMKKLANYYKLRSPILEGMYKVLYEDLSPKKAVKSLMKISPYEDFNSNRDYQAIP